MKEAKPDTRLRVDSVLCAAGVTKVVDFSKQYYEMALLVVEAMLNTADEQGDGEATKLARIWFRPIQEMLNELGRDEKMVDIQLRKKVLEKKLQVASVEDESEAD